MKRSPKVKPPDRELAHDAEVLRPLGSREGTAVFPVEILRSHPWLGEPEQRVAETLAGEQVVRIFSRKDPVLASDAIVAR